MIIYDDTATATTSATTSDTFFGANCDASVYICAEEEKPWKDDLYLMAECREWKEYLKSMWLKVLKLKGYFTLGQCLNCKLYYRRLLFSISGWLAREGYAKKN
jgi:hypothetical protein